MGTFAHRENNRGGNPKTSGCEARALFGEWNSHVNEVPGDIGKIAAALGCLTAAWDIAEGPMGTRKRVLDLAMVTLALALLGPLLLVTRFLIAADSPGPILVRQTRIGRDGKSFQALKFRTMYVNADDRLRVTRLGRVLRRTSIDELPQLFNVLMGDMSLVGPRPITEDEILSIETYTCKPGLTGLWLFGDHPSVALYTRNWSLMLDVKIILATIGAALKSDKEREYCPDFDADLRTGLLAMIPFALAGIGALLLVCFL